jgi:hypothetical protein
MRDLTQEHKDIGSNHVHKSDDSVFKCSTNTPCFRHTTFTATCIHLAAQKITTRWVN